MEIVENKVSNGNWIGRIVKLSDYSSYGDYQRHVGQVAEVIGYPDTGNTTFDLKIRWKDGSSSNVHIDNLIDADWDQ